MLTNQGSDALRLPPMNHGPSPDVTLLGMDASSLGRSQAIIILALTAASAIIILIFAFQTFVRRRLPGWLQPFAAEEPRPAEKKRLWTAWTSVLAVIGVAGLALAVVPVVLAPQYPINALDIVPWVSAVSITVGGRPVKTPRILLLQYCLTALAALGIYSVEFLENGGIRMLDPFRLSRLGLCFVAVIVIGNMPLRDPSWDKNDIGKASSPPTSSLRSPEDNLTLFQFWAMTWVEPLAKLSRKKELDVDDVWQLPYDYQHKQLYEAFRELKGKLLSRLIHANGLDLSIAVGLSVVEKVAEVSNIRLTSQLYKALDDEQPRQAIFWCLFMLCIDFVRQVSKTTANWYSRKAYERSRGETFIALFGKLLTRAVPGSDQTETGPAEGVYQDEGDGLGKGRLSRLWSRLRGRRHRRLLEAPVVQQASNAKVVNLVRGDTYDLSQRFWDFPKLVSVPIKVIFTVYYLIDIMGWPSSVGFGLMGLFLVVNAYVVSVEVGMERQRTAHTDRRTQAVAHFVEASRPLKMNGWTASWADRIMRFRGTELLKRLRLGQISGLKNTVTALGGVGYPLASICLYTLVLRQGLPNEVIWPSLQLFGHLEMSVKETFDQISAYWKATIPVDRVHKYMAEPDRDESYGDDGVQNIEFRGASFSWPSTDKLILRDINLRFDKGLTIIRGKVGAGKSSLLLAALNEMELHEGSLARPDLPVAYAQQTPWLQNKTIRENIVFGAGFDPKKYQAVLEACALLPDLVAMEDGDLTKLEEGGVGLSGGQKARVALARAVYAPCEILILDDPLSALDHDTASKIVQKLFKGPLVKNKAVVMVTHRDDLVLSIADVVVDLDEGRARVLTSEELEEERKRPGNFTAAESSTPQIQTAEILEADEVSKEGPEEDGEVGSVPMSVYTKYMAEGGWYLWILLAAFYSGSRFCDIARARLLEAWGADTAETPTSYWGLPDPELHPNKWLFVLAGLSGGQIATYAVAQLLLAKISVNAAAGLFKIAIARVGRATFRYLDTMPSGQLKNRLVADMSQVDGGILTPLESFLFNFISLSLSLFAIATHQPSLLIVLLCVSLLFVYFFRTYVPVSRSLRRMEMRYLTPIISNIGVMQDGLVTIRALRATKPFQDRHLEAVDDFQKQDHFFWSMQFWLDFRTSLSSACTRAVLILFMVFVGTPASAVGFVLTQTLTAMNAVQELCIRFAQLQLDAVSLERVELLSRIPAEPTGDDEPPENWPSASDAVTFQGVEFRYAADLKPSLDNVSFSIPGGSTCAVLGRTGSGKSTVANALLMTGTLSAGQVRIGGIDLSTIDRTSLRRAITFIQQDPTLFTGTLRDNLDPEGRFSDSECRTAIDRVLGPSWAMDSPVHAAGKNMSQGQRQLVGIGRAILRRSGLVVLDEATASIDKATAKTVQRVLREELKASTVVTIAHRLEAVEDADWCLRLEGGSVVECGSAKGLGKRVSR